MAIRLFWCWLRSDSHLTTVPVGTCLSTTALFVLFLCCPPGPGATHRQELYIIIVKHRLWRALIAHHGDRDGAAVHATVTFCRRDALPPVTASLIREHRLCTLAVDA